MQRKHHNQPHTVPALAYLDGGTAAMVLQVVVAGLLGLALFWKNLVWRVRRFFGGGPEEEKREQSDSEGPPDHD